MSLNPRHKSGRPIVYRKQTLAPISPRHNPFSILIRQLFPTESRNTGKDIYYNIFDDRPDNNLNNNLYRNASNRSRNVINFTAYRQAASLERLSSRDSGSHPSTFRSARSRRLGSPNRMEREQLPTRRSLSDWLQGTIPDRVAVALGLVLEDRIDTRSMGRSVSEHKSRSESLRRIRQTTLDSLDTETPA